MRSPEFRRCPASTKCCSNDISPHHHHYEETEKAFTVLACEDDLLPDPPPAPQPYRLTPSVKRHKNMSFAIITEPPVSCPQSRTPSPVGGRVSPFRPRGFVVPCENRRIQNNQNASSSPTKIPIVRRRNDENSVFGEAVHDYHPPLSHQNGHVKVRGKVHSHLSRSLGTISTAVTPLSTSRCSRPQRTSRQSFVLSPIVGSSPDSSQTQSSPKIRASKCRSQPQSRFCSPAPPPVSNRRRGSTSSTNSLVTRPPLTTKYANVQAKVNSFYKPKVPPKPTAVTDTSDSDQKPTVIKKSAKNTKPTKTNPSTAKRTKRKTNVESPSKVIIPKSTMDSNDILLQSETSEPIHDDLPSEEEPPVMAPIVDGRVLSATSVSHAINKMNDTVLNSETLMIQPEHRFSTRIPPTSITTDAVSTIISMAADDHQDNQTKTVIELDPVKIEEKKLEGPEKEVIVQESIQQASESKKNHVTTIGITSSKELDDRMKQNVTKIVTPDVIVVTTAHQTVIEPSAKPVESSADVKPIRITVQEKANDLEVESGNIRVPTIVTNGLSNHSGLPPNSASTAEAPLPSSNEKQSKKNICHRFFTLCKRKLHCNCCNRTKATTMPSSADMTSCFPCKRMKKSAQKPLTDKQTISKKRKLWDRINCCRKKTSRVGSSVDGSMSSCFPKRKSRKGSWAERREIKLTEASTKKPSRCSKECCKKFMMTMFCLNLCVKKKPPPPSIEELTSARRASSVGGPKKRSVTHTPSEEGSKLDMCFVEHSSHMKAAIPVLPVKLAWICLVLNCIAPGSGTILSGLFCLCVGKPRFSQQDGAKPRIGSLLINFIIGIGQFFTVLFCLVGWGWSIWWGFIMIKMAKKYQKIRKLEAAAKLAQETKSPSIVQDNHAARDIEKGKT